MQSSVKLSTCILVVDDEEILRSLVRDHLEEEGYEVTTAGDGDHAMEILNRRSFDLVILDIGMPRMGGLAVLQAMKDQGIRPRVIVLTGENDMDMAVQATKLGANDYLTKPFDMDELESSVRRILQV